MQILGRVVVVIVEYKVPEELHDPYVGHEIGHQALLLHLHHLRAKWHTGPLSITTGSSIVDRRNRRIKISGLR